MKNAALNAEHAVPGPSPAMTLPCTWAMVGFGMLRQRSEKPR
jgi:hypothetical protein